MNLTYAHLARYPTVFLALTGLRVDEFAVLLRDLALLYEEAEEKRLSRAGRRRAIGGGHPFELAYFEQVLLVVIWLRTYPIHEVLGFLFGVSDSTVCRLIARLLPLLEQAGKDTMRMPDPGKKRRKTLSDLLKDTPQLAVIIDTFEQRVQRPRQRKEADRYYSGKKKQHTLKSQVSVDAETGEIVDVAESVRGPTADLTVLKESQLLERLPVGVGGIGDLAYVGIQNVCPDRQTATPRRKPRSQERPPEDGLYNQAFAQRRVEVEHSIGRMRRYQCLTQMDRNHRRLHTERSRAVAGLVNRQLRSRFHF
jgi:hypothetical protein